MLKKRVIPMLLLSDSKTVKGVNFSDYRPTGSPRSCVRVFSAQDSDELIFLNINPTHSSKQYLLQTLMQSSKECFMPLTAGGGVSDSAYAKELFFHGADKIVVTSASITKPRLLTLLIQEHGSQAIVAGIDYRETPAGPRVFIHNGKEQTPLHPVDHALNLSEQGVGEVFINSIDRDGTMQGFDLDMISLISSSVRCPVIAGGGAGNYGHLRDLFSRTSASAAACGSLFHFGDNTPIRARSYLRNHSIPMRVLR